MVVEGGNQLFAMWMKKGVGGQTSGEVMVAGGRKAANFEPGMDDSMKSKTLVERGNKVVVMGDCTIEMGREMMIGDDIAVPDIVMAIVVVADTDVAVYVVPNPSARHRW